VGATVIGDLLVTDWDSHASLKVIDNARPNVSPTRLQDLGSTLSGLRATAHRKRAGGRRLSPDEDPLEEVSYTKGSGKQGASSKWVPPHKRPDTVLAGATAHRGIEGFGSSRQVHVNRILSLSPDLPVAVAVVDTPEKVDAFVPLVAGLVTGGLITVEDLHAIGPASGRAEPAAGRRLSVAPAAS
jgi:PII-like signaling protein